jgi:hypothetical protein
MSLINDALRQASEAHKEMEAPPVLDPFDGIKPEPIQPLPASPWSTLLPVLLVGVVVVAVLGVGGWLAWRSWNNKRGAIVAQARTLMKETPLPAAVPPPADHAAAATVPTPPKPSTAVPAPNAPAASSPATGTTAAPPVAATAAVPHPPAPKWPALRLQGIIFNPPNSSVFINNKMLFTDDEIQGVKVTDIGRHIVVVVLEGQTNTLVLR